MPEDEDDEDFGEDEEGVEEGDEIVDMDDGEGQSENE